MSNGSIKDYVLATLAEQPGIGNEDLAALVREEFPGASTTAASISSIKSNARRNGELELSELRTAVEVEAADLRGRARGR